MFHVKVVLWRDGFWGPKARTILEFVTDDEVYALTEASKYRHLHNHAVTLRDLSESYGLAATEPEPEEPVPSRTLFREQPDDPTIPF